MIVTQGVIYWPEADNIFFSAGGVQVAGEPIPLQGKPAGTPVYVDLARQTARRVRIFCHADDDPVNFTITGTDLAGNTVTEVLAFAAGNIAQESVNAYESVVSIVPDEPLTASTIGIGTGYTKWIQLNGGAIQTLVSLTGGVETTTWSIKFLNPAPYELNSKDVWTDTSALGAYYADEITNQTTSMPLFFADSQVAAGACRFEVSVTAGGDAAIWQINERG